MAASAQEVDSVSGRNHFQSGGHFACLSSNEFSKENCYLEPITQSKIILHKKIVVNQRICISLLSKSSYYLLVKSILFLNETY